MDKEEITHFLKGQIKKHGDDFAVVLKYRTDSGKTRKRYGRFVEFNAGEALILFNPDKGKNGSYEVDRIVDIKKGNT